MNKYIYSDSYFIIYESWRQSYSVNHKVCKIDIPKWIITKLIKNLHFATPTLFIYIINLLPQKAKNSEKLTDNHKNDNDSYNYTINKDNNCFF